MNKREEEEPEGVEEVLKIVLKKAEEERPAGVLIVLEETKIPTVR